MAKKNPFVFTISFNKTNPSHIRAVEILNGTENKAQLIASAVLQYLGEAQERDVGFSMEEIRPVVAALIKQEIKKAMQGMDVFADVPGGTDETDQVVDLTDDSEPMPRNKELARNVMEAMSAFRKT